MLEVDLYARRLYSLLQPRKIANGSEPMHPSRNTEYRNLGTRCKILFTASRSVMEECFVGDKDDGGDVKVEEGRGERGCYCDICSGA